MAAKAKAQQELVVHQPQGSAPTPINEGATILAMMERIAAMPDIPVERLEQMFVLHQRVQGEQARKEFTAAFTACQAEAHTVVRDRSNTQTRSKYATYAALDKALRPTYTKYGFGLSYNTGETPLPDHVRVLATLSHSGGHEREYHVDIPCDGKGAKGGDVMTKTHARGSAFTYGQRYLFILIFNVAVADRATDDDGNAAGGVVEDAPITDDQMTELVTLLDGVGADKARFCKFNEIGSLSEIMQSQFEKAKKQVLAKAKKAQSEDAP